MFIQFRNIEPHPLLKPYIEKMWLFESSGRMPVDDIKLVVPNGNIKLTLALQNGIVANMHGQKYCSKEHSVSLTGIVDVPLVLDTENDVATGTIGVEFNPQGAYRFFHLSLNEIQNQIYPLEDVLQNQGKQLQERIANSISINQKIAVLQQFLINQFLKNKEDDIFEYCVEKIKASNGKITVKELEKKTGYSSRWLNMKFTEKLGVSPKNLSSILKFKNYYHEFSGQSSNQFFKKDFYNFYYDQSHFIKSFKRFTGLSPARFEKKINDFGRKFYA